MGFSERLHVHKMYDDVHDLTFGTEESACFDIRAYLNVNQIPIKVWSSDNKLSNRFPAFYGGDYSMLLMPGDRALVPTGLIFDLNPNQSIRVHPRSGTSLKMGVGLANSEGIIDPDYTNESFLTLTNHSNTMVRINHDERYAQGEIVERHPQPVIEYVKAPPKRGNRTGGFGSTGLK